MKELTVIDSKNTYGNMNSNKKFFPADMTPEERQQLLLQRRLAFGQKEGFDGHKMFVADQLDSSKYLKGQSSKIGTHFLLTEEYAAANPNGWSDIPEDILIITDQAPGIVAGHPVADCPVVMITDFQKGFTAIGHCDASLIDEKLPMMIADALVEVCASRDEDLYAIIGPCAGPDWHYQNYPQWAKDSILWQDAITTTTIDNQTIYNINLQRALLKELLQRNIKLKHIFFKNVDTITNPEYYSNYASSPKGLNQPHKAGRQFVGAFYKNTEIKPKRKILLKNVDKR